MKSLRDWTARRAGGRITVYGTNVETGQDDKLTKIDAITPGPGTDRCTAKDSDGVEHVLFTR